jgi:hypothetical protein
VSDAVRHARRCVAAALLALALGTAACGDELRSSRVSLAALGTDAASALAALAAVGSACEFDVEALVAGLGSARLDVVLVDAPPASQRQALAHALGCWWAARSDGGTVFTGSRHLPLGPLEVTSATSSLGGRLGAEDLVRRLLEPWLGADTGLSLLPGEGTWTASLDAAGQARLAEAIALIERGAPQCSSLVPDAERPDLERRLQAPLAASTWDDLVDGLAKAGGCSVSLAATVRASSFPAGGMALPACRLADLPQALGGVGLDGRFIHGVLCLARPGARAIDREHPGQRRRLALIPIPHLAATRLDGEFIAAGLKRFTGKEGDWWAQPGAELVFLDQSQSLLVAADPATQTEVLDALGTLDRLGVGEGLAALAAGRP